MTKVYENVLNCKNSDEFRKWLELNHLTQKECWVKCKRGKPKDNSVFYYIDAVILLCHLDGLIQHMVLLME